MNTLNTSQERELRPGFSNYVISSSSESDDESINHIKSLSVEKNTAESVVPKAEIKPEVQADNKKEDKDKQVHRKKHSRSRSPNDRSKRHDRRYRYDRHRGSRDRDYRHERKRRDYDSRNQSTRERGYDRNRDDRRRPHREDNYRQQPPKLPPAEAAKKKFEQTSSKLKAQVEKRKQIWQQGSKEKKVANHWEAMLSTCTDEKQAEKLKKLIGLKENEEVAASTSVNMENPDDTTTSATSTGRPAEEQLKQQTRRKQEELFDGLNRQYEMGRMSTHMHRGLGLGFTSQMQEYANQIKAANTDQVDHK